MKIINFKFTIFNSIKQQWGFTLIELLIVIAVVGVLAGGVMTVINPSAQFQKANDARRKSDLAQIEKGLELYYQDNGHYPAAVNYGIEGIQWGSPWLPYMGTLPKDPSSAKNYAYSLTADGQIYYLYASLDRGANDPLSGGSGASCGSGVCNYSISNSNEIDPFFTPGPTSTPVPFACGDSITFTYKGSSVTYGTVSHNSVCWLDRNLGATKVAGAYNDCISYPDNCAYGDLFQWGRLDDDGHQTRTSGITTTLSTSDNPGHSNFIYGMGSPLDWRSPQNNALWQGVSGVNNPCPSGWRLPTSAEWDTERASWSPNNSDGAYSSPLKLTMAGYRHYNTGNINPVLGGYWSSSAAGANAFYLYFNSSSAVIYDDPRAGGLSVRCLKD